MYSTYVLSVSQQKIYILSKTNQRKQAILSKPLFGRILCIKIFMLNFFFFFLFEKGIFLFN